MKSLMRLLLCVLADAETWCRTSTHRDFKTITARVEHEGISFLTISLPTFCQDFERSLDNGYVAPTAFLGFRKTGSLPCLFRGLTELVFDPGSGVLLEEPDIHAIFFIRQLTLMFKKILIPCSSERESKAYARFIECEQEVRSHLGGYSALALQEFEETSRRLWGYVLQPVCANIQAGELIPRHGPGATAERISGNQKFRLATWYERFQPFFPADSFAIPNLGFADELESVDFLEPGTEIPVRVITVPKTQKTPRIIAIEPAAVQYCQQALLDPLVSVLESSEFTSGSINFVDQTVNQRLALEASRDGRHATIDLKDASDRVSCLLVERMLSIVPDLRDAVMACRSTSADVPGHGVEPLAKFASMGSALCFPMESMVFYTILIQAWHKSQGLRVSRPSLLRAKRDVRVYGDDLIVPVELVPWVVRELETYGLRVNQHKSFSTGKFRESCGVDAYDGVPVTPVYLRRVPPTSSRDASEILSFISFRNQLYKAGLWKTAAEVQTSLERFAYVPFVLETSPIQGFHSYLGYEWHAWDTQLHAPRVKGYKVKLRHRHSPLDGSSALLKYFLKKGEQPFHDVKHLERHGRPLSVDIKTGWAQPF